MTKLEAVNEALRWIGQPPVTALDTGGTSDEAEAESELDATLKEVMGRGWYCNTEEDVSFGIPNVKIAVTAVVGTFSYSEGVTEAVTGAVGFFAYLEGGFIYLNQSGGTAFTGGHGLTGSASGATATGGAYSVPGTAKIAYPSNMLSVEPSRTFPEAAHTVGIGGFFYDQENRTFLWSGSGLHMRVIKTLLFTELMQKLAEYVSKTAALRFLVYKMPGRTDAIELRAQEVSLAHTLAKQLDGDLRRTNLHQTVEARRFLGDRFTFDDVGPVTGMQNQTP